MMIQKKQGAAGGRMYRIFGQHLCPAKSKYACDEPDPASLCTAANTCGSGSAPCTVDITKSGSSPT